MLHIGCYDSCLLVLTLILMLQDLAARYGELEKSSRHICTSLTKLESVLNTDSSGKLGQPAKLLEPQRHEDSATCKGIHTSLANQTHNKIPDRNVKPSNDPNDISDENDKTKLFPLNDLMDSVKVRNYLFLLVKCPF